MKKDQNYVSEIDQLLAELRAVVPESKSQREEREKYQKVAQKRDHVMAENENEIWEEF